jgi:calcineurin-like phosphoesterase
MKILCIGDVTSPGGITHLCKNLWKFREREGIDFTIVNGENASFITGISSELAEQLLRHGADCITGGNHSVRDILQISECAGKSTSLYQLLKKCSQNVNKVDFIKSPSRRRCEKKGEKISPFFV